MKHVFFLAATLLTSLPPVIASAQAPSVGFGFPTFSWSGHLPITVTPPSSPPPSPPPSGGAPPPSGGGACPNGATPGITIPSGWNCDPALSDEFQGTTVNTSKWQFGTGGAHSTASCNDYVAPTQNNDEIQTMSYNSSTNTFNVAEDFEAIVWPPSNYYREVETTPAAASAGLDPATWTFGLNSDGTHAEIDEWEYGQINFYLWDPNWNLLWSVTNVADATGGKGNFFDGNPHILGFLKNNGQMSFYWDNALVYTTNDPDNGEFTNSQDEIIWQSIVENGCPANSGLPSSRVTNYVRIWHP